MIFLHRIIPTEIIIFANNRGGQVFFITDYIVQRTSTSYMQYCQAMRRINQVGSTFFCGGAVMSKRYIPRVTEAAVPEDGGWAELENEDVLVLSIPDWDLVGTPTESFQYAWLYDRVSDAYLLCFKINDETEKAIAFAKEHAGLLLTQKQAYSPFSIAITSHSLEQLDEQVGYLYLPNIELKRHPKAGW